MTLQEMQEHWAALQAARASGVLRVVTQTGGVRKEVQYRSDAELAAALGALERQMAALSSAPIHTIKIAATKGF